MKNQQLKYDIDKHDPGWITGGPWYKTYICKKFETVFENYIRNAITDRFKLMCYIDVHEKHQPSIVDGSRSGGGNAFPSNTTTEALFSLSETFDLIDCWIKCFDQNYLEHSNMYN